VSSGRELKEMIERKEIKLKKLNRQKFLVRLESLNEITRQAFIPK